MAEESSFNEATEPTFEQSADPIPKWMSPFGPSLTDLGNAERLLLYPDRDFAFVPQLGKWILWKAEEGRWVIDNAAEMLWRAGKLIRIAFELAATHPSSPAEVKEALEKHAKACESIRSIKAMVELASTCEAAIVDADQLDRNPLLLNVANGTIDLATGTLQPHDRADLQTKLSPVLFDPEAKCPTWEKFLDRIMGGNASVIEFVQRAVGYTLTGDTREECFFLFHGTGANGKSTFLEVIRELLGDYGAQADFSTFVSRQSEGGPREDIVALRGARMVATPEADEGKQLSETLLKQLTGRDKARARTLYKEGVEFFVSAKIFIAANRKPDIKGTDDGIWRRIMLVPFTVKIPLPERDKHLREKLLAELPGILAWAVRGCLAWQKIGLAPPAIVTEATKGYRTESDIVDQFLDEECVRLPKAKVRASILFNQFTEWAELAKFKLLNVKEFKQRMLDRGLQQKAYDGYPTWVGVGLRTDASLKAQAATDGGADLF